MNKQLFCDNEISDMESDDAIPSPGTEHSPRGPAQITAGSGSR